MTLNDYQAKAQTYGIYPKSMGVFYTILGLTGEAGEVSNKLKKILRDDNGKITEEMKYSLCAELGDVLWYLSEMCCNLNVTLDKIAQDNLNKLEMRKQTNKLHGNGDNR